MSKDQQTKFKNNQMLRVILVCLSIALFSYAIPLNNNVHELDNIKNTLDMIHQIKRQKDKIYNDAYRKGYAIAFTKLETKGEDDNNEL